ncbi:MAG: MBL fold metallo-hydrolase [Erysipelotrichaceae bacterium]
MQNEVKLFQNGPMANNTYLLTNGSIAVIIDPSFNVSKLINYVDTHKLVVKAILLTHAHYDHWVSLDSLVALYQCPFYLREAEHHYLVDKNLSLGQITNLIPLDYPAILNIDNFTFDIYDTPGHSPGSVCLLWRNNLFTGDCLFAGDIGRTDLPGGSTIKMRETLKYLASWTADYNIYPGHNESSSLTHEQTFNLSLAQFKK